jgi:hypothetical protein
MSPVQLLVPSPGVTLERLPLRGVRRKKGSKHTLSTLSLTPQAIIMKRKATQKLPASESKRPHVSNTVSSTTTQNSVAPNLKLKLKIGKK